MGEKLELGSFDFEVDYEADDIWDDCENDHIYNIRLPWTNASGTPCVLFNRPDHPGSVRMRNIIDTFVQEWIVAGSEQQAPILGDAILEEIKRNIEEPSEVPYYFLYGGQTEGDVLCCRKASEEEIKEKICDEWRSHFVEARSLRDVDILFPCEGLFSDRPGNMAMKMEVEQSVITWGNTALDSRHEILNDIRRRITAQDGRPRFFFRGFQEGDIVHWREASDTQINHEILCEMHRNFTIPLLENDILCGRGINRSFAHPWNTEMSSYIAGRTIAWAEAGSQTKRDLFSGMYTILVETHRIRFLFEGRREGTTTYCRAANREEIEQEIKDELKSHFNVIPNERDYIFGKGNAIKGWAGNTHYRNEIINPRKREYVESADNQRDLIKDQVYDAIVDNRGRFLYAWGFRPGEGCIIEDDMERIKQKLGHALRAKRGRS